jgi:LytS/YehU family sensor histidine kinase
MLRNEEDVLVTLDTELHFIQAYHALLKARYGEGINVDVTVNPKDLELRLPPLSLQVIIENAFSQNTMHRTAPLRISIHSDNKECLIIQNNIQPKTITDAFDYEAGLDNLVSKYRLLNERQVIIRDSKNERVIELPLIRNEMEISI